jgi:ribosome maturation factor RimP
MLLATTSPLHGIDRDALHRVVAPILHAHGAELVDIEFKPGGGGERGWVLRFFIERAGSAANRLSTRDAAVDLELCANVSRDLSPALDVADLIPHAYHLEVGSPGIERPLRTEADFVRFAGEKAKLKLREPIQGQRVIVGTLVGVDDGKVRVAEGRGNVLEVPLSLVEGARLLFELAARPKGSAITKPVGARPKGSAITKPVAAHPKGSATRSGGKEHRSKH